MMNQKGRSMIEMLGVLAIIGVLSVGGLEGYNRAMLKYKMNKQAESLNFLLSYSMELSPKLPTDTGWKIYNDLLKNLNMLPDHITYLPDGYLQDIFGNKLYFYRTSNKHWGIFHHLNESHYSYMICENIVNIAKAHQEDLHFIARSYDSASDWKVTFQGGKYCTKDKKCIKDLSLADIQNLCQDKSDNAETDRVSFWIIWE